MLKRLLSAPLPRPPTAASDSAAAGSSVATVDQFAPVPMDWFYDTQLPLADWQRIAQELPTGLDETALHEW